MDIDAMNAGLNGALAAAVFANGLRDGQDVRFGEGAAQGSAAMSARAECDQLVRVG